MVTYYPTDTSTAMACLSCGHMLHGEEIEGDQLVICPRCRARLCISHEAAASASTMYRAIESARLSDGKDGTDGP